MYYEFDGGGRPVKLASWNVGDVIRAQTLSQEHERFTYVLEGPDAEEAADSIVELVEGPRPTMDDVCYGVDMAFGTWPRPRNGG
jgi:hypothetical protein